MDVRIILSQSASAKMIFGFFPPNSNESFLNFGAAIEAMRSPALVLPVNDMALTAEWETIASPAAGPVPCIIFNTPGGNPASMQIRESKNAVTGVISEGFASNQ